MDRRTAAVDSPHVPAHPGQPKRHSLKQDMREVCHGPAWFSLREVIPGLHIEGGTQAPPHSTRWETAQPELLQAALDHSGPEKTGFGDGDMENINSHIQPVSSLEIPNSSPGISGHEAELPDARAELRSVLPQLSLLL